MTRGTIANPFDDVQSPRGAGGTARTLDGLLDLGHAELVRMYEGATLPALASISGDLRGRMLAVPALPDRVTALPRAWARGATFPWRGKSFVPGGADRGEGINRVVSDRLKLFRFETFVGPSRHDGRPAIQLDYDHRGNPGLIRRVEDEIREVRPGLFLGQAWLRLRGKKHFVLWFALEQRA